MREEGHASLELALGVGLLVLPAVIVVLSFGPWLEAQAFVRSAAAEAARAAVLASGDPTGTGHDTAVTMAEARGYGSADVVMCGGGTCQLERGAYVTASVGIDVPLISTPWGGVGGLEVRAVHSEPVDAYRSLP